MRSLRTLPSSSPLWFGALALFLVVSGCAEKITGPGQAARVTVDLELKAGPSTTFRLTVFAADMDSISTLMVPADDRLVAQLTVPIGAARHFVAEALDVGGTVLYSGEAVRDVTALVPLDLTIDLAPVAPLVYLNPHFASVPLGASFTILVNANDLPGTSRAGIGFSLYGLGKGDKFADIAVIDSLELAPEQVARGSSLSYEAASTYVYFDVSNELTIVDDAGDDPLVIIHCRTHDTWPSEPVTLVPAMFIEVLDGYPAPLDSVFVDNAAYTLVRGDEPASYLGNPYHDEGVALVGVEDGEAVLAGTTSDPQDDLVPQLYLARLDDASRPLWTSTLAWNYGDYTTGLARATDGGFFVSGASQEYSGAVVRVDPRGNELWRVNLANIDGGTPFAVAARPRGGCVAAGTWANDGLHFYLAVFTEDDYLQSFAPTDFSRDQAYNTVVVLDDTTFAAAGYEQPFSGTSDAILARFTFGTSITPTWSRHLGGSGNEFAHDLLALNDGYLVVGAADTLETGRHDLYAVRTDQDGLPLWSRYFGVPERDEVGWSVIATPDGAFLAVGTAAPRRKDRDVYVVKFDGAGQLIWETTVGGAADDVARDVVSLGDDYLITGSSDPGPHGATDILVLRLGGDGKRLAD